MSEARAARPWWLRWYGLAGFILIFGLLVALAAGRVLGFYNLYHIPSEAMEPTLMKGDQLVASLRGPGNLRRGDVVVIRMPRSEYIKRVAALPGDTIELVGGQVYLNDRPVAQRQVSVERRNGPYGSTQAWRFAEQFPGEQRPHHIQDIGPSSGDDFPKTRIEPGHVFVLGDNRDVSADSRFPAGQMGVGQLPIERIRGKARFHSFGSSKSIGAPIGP